jgi:hypothetical protein
VKADNSRQFFIADDSIITYLNGPLEEHKSKFDNDQWYVCTVVYIKKSAMSVSTIFRVPYWNSSSTDSISFVGKDCTATSRAVQPSPRDPVLNKSAIKDSRLIINSVGASTIAKAKKSSQWDTNLPTRVIKKKSPAKVLINKTEVYIQPIVNLSAYIIE